MHFRGRVRHPLTRQLADHSTFLAPYNVLVYLFSAVPTGPILDPRDLPALEPLREHWRTIRDEALALLDAGRIAPSERFEDIAFNTFFRRGWKRFYIKWYGDVLPSAAALCPETSRLVRAIPSINAALFALLPPGGRLGEHRDPFAGSLRYHLGLLTPNADTCRLYVDGTPLAWRDGEALLFDETYVHRAVNESDVTRIILFCDVTRPLRTRAMRALNDFVIRHVVRHTASRNEADEPLGALAGVASWSVRTKQFFRRLKKRTDLRLYYGVKYGVGAGIVWLLFFSGLVF